MLFLSYFLSEYYHDLGKDDEHKQGQRLSQSGNNKMDTKTTSTTTSCRQPRNGENKQTLPSLSPPHVGHLDKAARRAIEKAMFDTICAFSSADNHSNTNHHNNNNSNTSTDAMALSPTKHHPHRGEKTTTASEEFKFRLYQPETTATTGAILTLAPSSHYHNYHNYHHLPSNQ